MSNAVPIINKYIILHYSDRITGKNMRDVNKYSKYVYFLVPILLIIIWNIFTVNKTAPITEGWYAVYSDMVLSGKIPYVDFEFVYPPLYLYTITGFSLIFGGNLLSYRILGALFMILCYVALYCCFRLYFKESISAIAAFVSNTCFFLGLLIVDYDYHSLYHLTMYIVILCFGIAIKSMYEKKSSMEMVMLFLTGLFASLTLMVRIPLGIMCILLPVILYYIVRRKEKTDIKHYISYAIGIVIPIIALSVYLISNGALTPFIDNVLNGETKGSMLTICTRWIKTWIEDTKLIVIVLFVILTYILYQLFNDRLSMYQSVKNELNRYLICSIVICAVVAVLFYHRITLFETNSMSVNICFTILLTLGLLMLISRIKNIDEGKQGNTMLFLLISFFGIQCLDSAISGAFDPYVCNLGYGITIGLIILLAQQKVNHPIKTIVKPCVIICISLIVISPIATSIATPYQWWGAIEETYINNTETTDIEYFENIYMTKSEKELYEGFIEICNKNLEDGDEIYCFSNNAIFYKLADVSPSVRAPVPWMDVCKDSTARTDLEYLKNNNPKIIVYSSTGNSIEVHEEIFRDGNYCGQRYINDWIVYCIINNIYDVCGEYHTYGGNVTKILVKK